MRQVHTLSEAEFWEEVRRHLAEYPDSTPDIEMAEEAEHRAPELAAARHVITRIADRVPGRRIVDAPEGVRRAYADACTEYRTLLGKLAVRPLPGGYAWREIRPGREAAEVLATSDIAAGARVRELLCAGQHERSLQARTYWLSAVVWRTDSYGEQMPATTWTVIVAVHPPAPPCSAGRGEHEWPERPGPGKPDVEGVAVSDNVRGLLIIRTCSHCECRQSTSTWATDPVTGEEGLTAIFYITRESP